MRRFLIPAAAVVAVMLLIAGATVALMSARANADESVPVALVNLDEPVTVENGEEEQTIAAGRLLAAEITTGSESELAWTMIDGDAIDVNETEFYAVVTIPEDFSAAISGISDGSTQPATITLETDDPASPTAARVAEQVTDAATEAFNADFTSTYLENVYLSYDGIKEAVGEAATGSSELESSTQQLSDGAADLADGATGLAGGTASTATASQSLADGAGELADGTASTATASQSLADGAGELADGTASTATASQSLSSGATATADGATDVADGATTLAAALESAASTTSGTLVPLTSSSAEQSANLAQTLAGLAQNCPPSAGPAYCASVAEAAQASVAAAETSGTANATATGISSGLDDASQASDSLAAGAASVSQGVADTAEGSTALASALGDLSEGSDTLAQSSDDLASALGDLSEGSNSLAQSSDDLASALGDLSEGSDALAQSSGELASGADDVAEGATSLTDGLREIEESVPFYEEDVQVELANAVASPATITRAEEEFGGAARFVAIAAVLALWFGVAVTYIRRPAVPRWALSGGLASRAVATGLVPRLAVAVIGSATLWGLFVSMGASGPNPVPLLMVLLTAAICLTAILHAIFTLAGRAGHLVIALFGLLQLASAGLYAPIETTAPMLQSLSEVMPLSLTAQLIRDVVFARPIEPLGVMATFVAWFLLAVTASIAITRSRASNEYRTAV